MTAPEDVKGMPNMIVLPPGSDDVRLPEYHDWLTQTPPRATFLGRVLRRLRSRREA